jgi:hypothetical protein
LGSFSLSITIAGGFLNSRQNRFELRTGLDLDLRRAVNHAGFEVRRLDGDHFLIYGYAAVPVDEAGRVLRKDALT